MCEALGSTCSTAEEREEEKVVRAGRKEGGREMIVLEIQHRLHNIYRGGSVQKIEG